MLSAPLVRATQLPERIEIFKLSFCTGIVPRVPYSVLYVRTIGLVSAYCSALRGWRKNVEMMSSGTSGMACPPCCPALPIDALHLKPDTMIEEDIEDDHEREMEGC